jgi:hypothetical protein
MAKRHHSSKRARKHEHMGMERYERGSVMNHEKDRFNDEHHSEKDDTRDMYMKPVVNGGFYGDKYARERMEMQDASMIHEDHRAIANLPQEVMIKPYPRTGPYMPEALDDTIRGVDGQMNYDDRQRRSHFYAKKV